MNCISTILGRNKKKKGGKTPPPPPKQKRKPVFGYMVHQDFQPLLDWIDTNLSGVVSRAGISVDGKAGKWPNMLSKSSESIQDVDLSLLRKSIQYAEDRGHKTKWHFGVGYKPKWVPPTTEKLRELYGPEAPEGYNLGDRDLREVNNRIFLRTVLNDIGDRLDVLEVANEVLDPQGRGFRSADGMDLITVDEIAGYFLQARIFTQAQLGINEYGVQRLSDPQSKAKHGHLVKVCRGLLERGVELQYVGLQSHDRAWEAPTYSERCDAIGAFKDLGLEVHLTENDTRMYAVDAYPVGVHAIDAQNACVEDMVRAAVDMEVEYLMTWGLVNGHWWGYEKWGLDPDKEHPLPFAADGTPRDYWHIISQGVA